jgi:hypothetical protein
MLPCLYLPCLLPLTAACTPQIECEHGYDTPCCSKHGKLLKAGVVCW